MRSEFVRMIQIKMAYKDTSMYPLLLFNITSYNYDLLPDADLDIGPNPRQDQDLDPHLDQDSCPDQELDLNPCPDSVCLHLGLELE